MSTTTTTTDLEPHTRVYYTHLPPPFPAAPAFSLQLTRMKDTLMVWVGTGGPGGSGDDDRDGGEGSGEADSGRRIAAEWAVAMPSAGVSVLERGGNGGD